MTPSFRHMGGKARMRQWLVSHFPSRGGMYVEPFAGKGNVYFYACQQLDFHSWLLSDIDVSFLKAVLFADLGELPEWVSKGNFDYWKQSRNLVATLIGPRVTFAGKGYAAGFSGTSGTHVGYSRKQYEKVCMAARQLLAKTVIAEGDWRAVLMDQGLSNEDFVYLDPPYYGTKADMCGERKPEREVTLCTVCGVDYCADCKYTHDAQHGLEVAQQQASDQCHGD